MSMPGMLYVKNVDGVVVAVVAVDSIVVGAIVAAVPLDIAAAVAVVAVDENIIVVAAGVGSVRLRIRRSIFGRLLIRV